MVTQISHWLCVPGRWALITGSRANATETSTEVTRSYNVCHIHPTLTGKVLECYVTHGCPPPSSAPPRTLMTFPHYLSLIRRHMVFERLRAKPTQSFITVVGQQDKGFFSFSHVCRVCDAARPAPTQVIISSLYPVLCRPRLLPFLG